MLVLRSKIKIIRNGIVRVYTTQAYREGMPAEVESKGHA